MWNADSGASGVREPVRKQRGLCLSIRLPNKDAWEHGDGGITAEMLAQCCGVPFFPSLLRKEHFTATELGRGEATPRLGSDHEEAELALGLSRLQRKPGRGDGN